MHKFLRAIGFSTLYKRGELKNTLRSVLRNPTYKQYVSLNDDSIAVEYRREFANGIGIAVCGEYSDDVEFDYEYYYPYFVGTSISTSEDVTVERHAEKESYAGVCEDNRIGVTLIFYLQNRMDYMKEQMGNRLPEQNTSVSLSGLALNGSIMLPLKKNPKQLQAKKKADHKRDLLMTAARQGDENAIESLTLDDIDMYSVLSRKILDEDVFTLVDTYFMPYGIECDQYSILGEIVEVAEALNELTKETIYIITMNCNDLIFDICINKKDLVGEPAAGRRSKGIIWLQGHINFPE